MKNNNCKRLGYCLVIFGDKKNQLKNFRIFKPTRKNIAKLKKKVKMYLSIKNKLINFITLKIIVG